MSFLLFQLQRLVMLPFDLLMPSEGMNDQWARTERGKAFLLGVPAIVLAIVGVSLLCWAKFGIADELEERYKDEVSACESELRDVNKILNRKLKMAQNALGPGAELSPDVAETVKQARDLLNEKETLLKKLSELDPDNLKYPFDLALVALRKSQRNRGLSLMRSIAPLEEPGHLPAHLYLAKHHLDLSRGATKAVERNGNAELSIDHCDQALVRDQENLVAKVMKAQMLTQLKSFAKAREIFVSISEERPTVYKDIVLLNNALKEGSKNEEVISRAADQFERKLSDDDLAVNQYQLYLAELANCRTQLGDYETLDRTLKRELASHEAKGSGDPDAATAAAFVKRLLAKVYYEWSNSRELRQLADRPQRQLELLAQGYQYSPDVVDVLRGLTDLGEGDSEIASKAREIYDPRLRGEPGTKEFLKSKRYVENRAPASVLSALGAQALEAEENDLAIRYFELARSRSPNDAAILNNLAYAYLQSGNDPATTKKALSYVDDALRNVPNTARGDIVRASFLDTRANALIAQERFTDAISDLEQAFLLRKRRGGGDVEGILESLIRCSEAIGTDARQYQQILDDIRSKKQAE